MQALHQNFWFTKRYDLNLQGSCPDQKTAYIIMYISHRKGDCEQVLCNYRSCSQPRCWGSFIVVRLIATLQLCKGWRKWANFIVAETKIIITSTTMHVSSATLLLWLLSSLMLGGRGDGECMNAPPTKHHSLLGNLSPLACSSVHKVCTWST